MNVLRTLMLSVADVRLALQQHRGPAWFSDSRSVQELRENKDRLLGRVANLKSELTDWRGKLDEQMTSYRTELGDLRKHLNKEVEELRDQFSQLQGTIQAQLQETRQLADAEGSLTAKAAHHSPGKHVEQRT